MQQRLRTMRVVDESGETDEVPEIPSSIPFLSNVASSGGRKKW